MDGPVHFLNLEYFLRLIYLLVSGKPSLTSLEVLMAKAWIMVNVIGYAVALLALWVLVYSILKMKQVQLQDAERYTTIGFHEADHQVDVSRLAHVKELMLSTNVNDWRQAIIEADIMLAEILEEQGFQGFTIGDKLKGANPARFHTLNEAWEAHKVRNEIAHQGSQFDLTERLAHRTVNQYLTVFAEFGQH